MPLLLLVFIRLMRQSTDPEPEIRQYQLFDFLIQATLIEVLTMQEDTMLTLVRHHVHAMVSRAASVLMAELCRLIWCLAELHFLRNRSRQGLSTGLQKRNSLTNMQILKPL